MYLKYGVKVSKTFSTNHKLEHVASNTGIHSNDQTPDLLPRVDDDTPAKRTRGLENIQTKRTILRWARHLSATQPTPERTRTQFHGGPNQVVQPGGCAKWHVIVIVMIHSQQQPNLPRRGQTRPARHWPTPRSMPHQWLLESN